MIRSPKTLAEWSEFTPRVWTKELDEGELESSCVVLKRKRDRRMMIKLTGGTAAFQIEVGRWQGVERKERTCKECQSEEVEASATSRYSAQIGTISGDPWWRKSASVMAFKGRVSPSRRPLFWLQHAQITLFLTISDNLADKLELIVCSTRFNGKVILISTVHSYT